MKFISLCNRIIEYSFYALFFFVPLVFSGSTSELFEFPKMWLTFALTILIFTAWLIKTILERKILIQRTPLDIPIALFLVSQIISTIFSLDRHVSLWGYYSRFNGGLFSIISYIFLYYALVTNFDLKKIIRLVLVGSLSALIVALWGFPSHFGIDATCFIFRGNFDTSCWTDAFKPTVRIFSTLGQPAWLAAYTSIFIPLTIACFLALHKAREKGAKNNSLIAFCLLLIALLLYANLTYTDTRGGFIGFWIANIIFWAAIYLKKLLKANFLKYFLIFNISFLIFNFLQGIPISQVSKFTLPEISKSKSLSAKTAPKLSAGELGGTDSGQIRLLVWKGAIDAWKAHPIFGTGVETFAYAYYRYKPAAHNLTTEWDFIYNKAHNEYLNYLATTGAFGFLTYCSIILVFLWQCFKFLNSNIEYRNSKQIQNQKYKNSKPLEHSNSDTSDLSRISAAQGEPRPWRDFGFRILILALTCAYISILVSNFFGFSVVIINLYFFLIPAFVFIISGTLDPDQKMEKLFGFSDSSVSSKSHRPNIYQWSLVILVLLVMSYLLSVITNYWNADILYALGSNLNKGGSYQEAYKPLENALLIKPGEPVYKDEFSLNLATLATGFYMEKDASTGAQIAKEALDLNTQVVSDYPNNIVYWKNRVRLFYTLAQGDPIHKEKYLSEALKAITKAQHLAPNDAKISYNLGVLLSQSGNTKKGIEVLEATTRLKPDYRDAYFALGLFYRELGENQKAINAYQHILTNIDSTDKQVKETLASWK